MRGGGRGPVAGMTRPHSSGILLQILATEGIDLPRHPEKTPFYSVSDESIGAIAEVAQRGEDVSAHFSGKIHAKQRVVRWCKVRT